MRTLKQKIVEALNKHHVLKHILDRNLSSIDSTDADEWNALLEDLQPYHEQVIAYSGRLRYLINDIVMNKGIDRNRDYYINLSEQRANAEMLNTNIINIQGMVQQLIEKLLLRVVTNQKIPYSGAGKRDIEGLIKSFTLE